MIRAVAVVVPANNEQELIGPCLAALDRARAHLRRRRNIDVRVMVVLDSCTDATGRIVAHAAVETLSGEFSSVGAARAAGTARLLRDTIRPLADLWLANTDADSQVRPDWLTGMVELADRGADVLLGTVLPGPGLPRPVELRWHDGHVLRDDHPHVHGANFGIRAEAYAALRGWSAVATGEDVLLARRAVAAGHLRVVRTATSPVLTSVRAHGRAPGGFSSHLRGLASDQPTNPSRRTPSPGRRLR